MNFTKSKVIPANINESKLCNWAIWKKIDYGDDEQRQSINHGHTFNLEENVLNWSISGMFYNLWKNYSIII